MRPNIILVLLDGMRSDRLGCYGYGLPTSPTIDALAKDGIVCEKNYSVSNCTIPAYFSMLTGLYPAVHRATPVWGYYDGKFPFATDLLQDAGYRTVGISNSVFGFSIETGFIRGYDRYYQVGRTINWFKVSKDAKRRRQHPTPKERARALARGALARVAPSQFDKYRASKAATYYANHDMGGRKALDIFNALVPELAADRSRPFFIYINIPEAHSPYLPPASVRDEFGRPELTVPLVTLMMNQMEFERRGMRLAAKETQDLSRLYDATVKYADSLVAELVSTLKQHSMYDETVLLLVSDHGGMLNEKRGYLGASCYTYEPEIRVPFIVANHGGARGTRAQLTSSIDVFPTLLEIAGVDFRFDQLYLCKSVLSKDCGHDFVVSDYPKWSDIIVSMNEDATTESVLKYSLTNRTIITDDGRKLIWRHDGRHEMYDLREDPTEEHNLFPAEGDAFVALMDQLKRFYRQQIGWKGDFLELYEHNGVEGTMAVMPNVAEINPRQRRDAVITVEPSR